MNLACSNSMLMEIGDRRHGGLKSSPVGTNLRRRRFQRSMPDGSCANKDGPVFLPLIRSGRALAGNRWNPPR